MPSGSTSLLAQILRRAGPLAATPARDGELLRHGHIYVASPDTHLVLEPARLRLVQGPRENGHRPSIDVLFRSAARAYGPRAVGVILSGTLDDGTAGLLAIKRQQGKAVVQQPADARFPGMPQSALEHVVVDAVLPVTDIPAYLVQLAQEPVRGTAPLGSADLDEELRAAELDLGRLNRDDFLGNPAIYACPDCHGALWEIHDEDLVRYRCRVGHAYSAHSLLAGQSDAMEGALWMALRAMEEKASLAARIAERATKRGELDMAERFTEQEQDARQRAAMIQAILSGESQGAQGPASADPLRRGPNLLPADLPVGGSGG